MFEITVDASELEQFAEALARAQEKIQEVLVQATKEAENLAYERLTTYAESPTYPISWDTAKQKRAFFATDGFGGGIPHERANDLPQLFQKTEPAVTPDHIHGEVVGQEPWLQFLMGDRNQSNIHRGRWKTDREIRDEIQDQVREIFANAVREAAAGMFKT